MSDKMSHEEQAVRAHDITVCLQRKRASEYDNLPLLGLAVRLALHLRGAPGVSYGPLKALCVHRLNFQTSEVKPTILLLAEAEFVDLVTEGNTIKRVIPNVPYFADLYSGVGEVVSHEGLSELEILSLEMVDRLAKAPVLADHLIQTASDVKTAKRIIELGNDGGFIFTRRARGINVCISPAHFGEHLGEYTDFVASYGEGRVKRVLTILQDHQGWPLSKIERDHELGGYKISDEEMRIIRYMGGYGAIQPPAIETTYAGKNYFLFGPKPGIARLPLHEKDIYERAMALVAAVRQGQFLPEKYKILYPVALLRALQRDKEIGASSEAVQQYRQVAALRIGRIEPTSTTRAKFVLIDVPENLKAVDLAIQLISGSESPPPTDDTLTLALRKGDTYIESLVAKSSLVQDHPVKLEAESQREIDNILLSGWQ